MKKFYIAMVRGYLSGQRTLKLWQKLKKIKEIKTPSEDLMSKQ